MLDEWGILTAPDDCNELTHDIIGGVIEVHRRFGPGLLESTYSTCLKIELEARGHAVNVRVPVPLEYRGARIDAACWIDMLVDDRVILELKAVEALAPVHSAQLLTYLRLTGRAIGLLINFNVPVVKDGIKRIVNRSRIDVSVAPFLRCDPVPSVISVMSNRSLCYPP